MLGRLRANSPLPVKQMLGRRAGAREEGIMKKTVIGLILLLSGAFLLGEEPIYACYSSESEGFWQFNGNRMSYSINEYHSNGYYYPEKTENNIEYHVETRNGIEYLVFNNSKLLMLRSTILLMLFAENGELQFEGVTGSGRYIEDLLYPENIRASSFLIEKGKKYESNNIILSKLEEPWVEGVKGYGNGEYVEMTFPEKITGIIIVNGFISYRNPELYIKNCRLKIIEIYDDTGFAGSYVLFDTPAPQVVILPKSSINIRIKIKDVYSGTVYEDTCLSMVMGIMYISTFGLK